MMIMLTLGSVIFLYILAIAMVWRKGENRRSYQRIYARFSRIVQTHISYVLDNPSADLSGRLAELKRSFAQLQREFSLGDRDIHLAELMNRYFHSMLSEANVLTWRTHENHDRAKATVMEWIAMLNKEDPMALMPDEDDALFRQAYQAILGCGGEEARAALDAIAERYQQNVNAHKAQVRANRIAMLISVVGVMLAIFFGLYAFTQG
jgi:hypothetical protein